jgi:hypothetical protein
VRQGKVCGVILIEPDVRKAMTPMKNPAEVLWMKEQELVKVRKEIEALRIAARLLSDESPNGNDGRQDQRHLVEMP